MQMNPVEDTYNYLSPAARLGSPSLHAVTPDVNLKSWNGVPPYAVWAGLGYLLVLAVIFSDQIVPYCEANFAQPQNCAPIFGKIIPIFVAGIILAPALAGAVQRMGGNKATGLAFSFAVAVVPPVMLGWSYLLG
ncbi:hypothetical protein [Rhodovulum sulfidophilum]|uniref:hypothetical protein n=1 Tax=Rhodovulum sulfidophilum TaxID=35806 RepID=UPI001389F498|nr:hypothetical protein [Rhodovulum sulfidophilum]NDK35166.1 hypothetical protein [Rhodovulum sulfidophilum]